MDGVIQEDLAQLSMKRHADIYRAVKSFTYSIQLPILLLLFGLILPWSSYAQTYPFKSYSTADGLAQAKVLCSFQDSRGFLWFGTSGGLSRFDGRRFTNYFHQEKGFNDISRFWEDRDSTIWIATTKQGIAKLRVSDMSVTWMKASDGILRQQPKSQDNMSLVTAGT